MLFFIFLPIGYPLIYSWIYNNEVAREVSVVLIDNSHSAKSREFAQKYDASPDVCIAYRSGNMSEAKSLIGRGKAYGIIYIPHDFDKDLGRHTQAHISVYCDMSYMLAYKAIFQTATAVSSAMGSSDFSPLLFEEVPIFNVTGQRNGRIRQLYYSWSSNTHYTASPIAWCRNDSWYSTREATLWRSLIKRPGMEDYRYVGTQSGIPHVIQRYAGMDNTYSTSNLRVCESCSRPYLISLLCAIPIGMCILCNHRQFICQISRECYAHRRLHLIANAIPLWSQLAIK